MLRNFLYDPQEEIVHDFLARYKFLTNDDAMADHIWNLTLKTLRKLRVVSKDLDKTSIIQVLEERWYNSLAKGQVDMGVYFDHIYLSELLSCYLIYSRAMFKHLMKPGTLKGGSAAITLLGDPRSILDLGCGLGYTTGILAQLYPKANVYGIELPGTPQEAMATELGKRNRFKMVTLDELSQLGHIDIIFGLNFFDRLYSPVDYLEFCLSKFTPNTLVLLNSFGTSAVGSFKDHEYMGLIYPANKLHNIFKEYLRRRGFMLAQTKLWNNRPMIWRMPCE